MESASSYLFEFFIIFLLIFFNALFVATEYAIVRVRSSEVEALMKQGTAGVKDVKDIINNLDKYISSTQLGITIVNLLLGWIGEDIFVKLLHPLFAMTTLSKPIVNTLSVIIGLGIITYFTITIGELAPKAIAIKNYKKIIIWFSNLLSGC